MSENFTDIENSFQRIIKANEDGLLDDFMLVKALESVREKTGWVSDTHHEIVKSKTFNDYLNGLEPDENLFKALREGESKVKNGVLYVVKKTKGGKLDWRKAVKQPKKKAVDDYDDFPDDISKLVPVNKTLGGSTGARLMEDPATGKKFVLKRGASPAHVEEEYLATKIYEEIGLTVPRMQIYEKGTSNVAILSEYMENTEAANNILDDNLKQEILKGYVADCLLANWDAYKNDNILVNKDDGLVYRVDNGGSLRFSATGRDKGAAFTDEVDELDSMVSQNLAITHDLTQKDINSQIKDLLSKEKAILSLIEDKDLKVKMAKRFFDLQTRLEDDEDYENDDPYRELTEKEIEKALKKAGGKITNQNSKVGWMFLSEICKMRGFDKKPELLDDKKFDKLLEDDDVKLIQRGLTGTQGVSAQTWIKNFKEKDDCFYGMVGMYGAGIYAAVNKTKKNPPPPNGDYSIALDYAGQDASHIIDIAIDKDVRVIDAHELDEMMNEEFFGEEFKEKKKEYDDLKNEVDKLNDKARNIEKIIEQDVKDSMGWNQKVLDALNSRADIVYADPEVHSFSKAKRYYQALVKSLGAKVTEHDGGRTLEIELPLSPEKFMLNVGVAERSVKQKNALTNKYNHHYSRLRDFVISNHYGVINKEIQKELKNSDKIEAVKKEAKDAQDKLKAVADEVNTLRGKGSSSLHHIMADIAKRPNGEFRGFYAAIKGYDMIIQKNGWGGSTDFAIILNRGKMKVRKNNKSK
jgi:hypothetical protein